MAKVVLWEEGKYGIDKKSKSMKLGRKVMWKQEGSKTRAEAEKLKMTEAITYFTGLLWRSNDITQKTWKAYFINQ